MISDISLKLTNALFGGPHLLGNPLGTIAGVIDRIVD